ncbi:hypothetical protein PAMP_007183 [Pampus punctatissimus]
MHSPVSDPAAAGALSRVGHTAAAVLLGFILVLGFLGNFLALVVFSRFIDLRTPVNLLLINISVSDMLVCIFGTPISFASSVRGRWLTGSYGCRWYGFSNALFGIVSLVSLSLLSFERYLVVLHSSSSEYCSQYRRARLAVAASWLYSLVWTLPPLLGWSRARTITLNMKHMKSEHMFCVVEQLRARGSWHHLLGPMAPALGNSSLLHQLLVHLLPASASAADVLLLWEDPAGCAKGGETVHGASSSVCESGICVCLQVTRNKRSSAERRESRVLLMVVSMVTGYLLCWMPYGVVAILSSFGRPGVVPPAASLIPSLLAKTSTVLNPVIYVLLNKQFCRCFLYMIRCTSDAPPILPSSRGACPLAAIPPTDKLSSTCHAHIQVNTPALHGASDSLCSIEVKSQMQ